MEEKAPTPGWVVTLRASSFQYLLNQNHAASHGPPIDKPRVSSISASSAPPPLPATLTSTSHRPTKGNRPKNDSASDDEESGRRKPKKAAPAKRKRKSIPEPPPPERDHSSARSDDGTSFTQENDDEGEYDADGVRRSQPDKDNGKFGLGWSAADDELLRKLGTRLNGETWQQVADAFPARTLRGVKERWRKKKVNWPDSRPISTKPVRQVRRPLLFEDVEDARALARQQAQQEEYSDDEDDDDKDEDGERVDGDETRSTNSNDGLGPTPVPGPNEPSWDVPLTTKWWNSAD